MRARISICAALAWAASLGVAGADAPPIFQAGAPDASPRARGAVLAARVKDHFPDLERRYDAFLNAVMDQRTADAWAARVPDIRASSPPALREEINGFADALRLSSASRLGDGALSLDEFWLFQSASEIVSMTGGSALGVDGAATQSGAALAGRVLSGPGAAAARELTAITVHDDGRAVVVLIGPVGMAGALNGFNAAGLFGALVDGPPQPLGIVSAVSARVAALDLRRALTEARSVGAATSRIDRAYSRNHLTLLADRASARVLEAPIGQPARLRDAQSPTRLETAWDRSGSVAAVSCFVLARAEANCHALPAIYAWRRLRAAAGELAYGQIRAADLLRVFTNRNERPYAAFGDDAVAALVFETGSGVLHLASADGFGAATPQRYGALIAPGRRGAWAGLDGVWLMIIFVLGAGAAAVAYARFKS